MAGIILRSFKMHSFLLNTFKREGGIVQETFLVV